MEEPTGRPWHVFATYLAAIAGIFATTGVAVEVLRAMYPDVPEATVVRTLPGLLAGSLAASSGLVLTILLVVRPLEPARLRLRPGWETGPALAVMTLGLLALGQALDSLVTVAGLADRGSLVLIRQVLHGTRGPDLFAAVLVLGVGAGAAEELFFRGYMQSRLREHWSAPAAVVATSAAFAALHLDASAVHTLLAFALGLYLGFVAELSGSTLPAVVCHVVNNVVYTLQTALGLAVTGRGANLAAAAVGAALFVACVWWLRRASPGPAPV
ncbi:MAG TPA: CPBP family intramembrane glutamic endopeptidase [Methylomirabilota bacterium]|nr:CPBP family intramembrane glutamic endopeptidase [Methylomirabilota bacterium]